jgi:hypothetical protein
MPEKAWKRTERIHAKRHNAWLSKRLGPFHGSNYPDSVSDFLAIESKHTQKIPDWLWEAMCQAIENEERWRSVDQGYPKIPVVILHESGQLFDHDLVVIRDDIFREVVMTAIAALGETMRIAWGKDVKK